MDELVAGRRDTELAAVCSALGDETRWSILTALGTRRLSASELAATMPISRQAVAKHLAVLAEAGLVESVREGQAVRFSALGARLSELGHRLEAIGNRWDVRLAALKDAAERSTP